MNLATDVLGEPQSDLLWTKPWANTFNLTTLVAILGLISLMMPSGPLTDAFTTSSVVIVPGAILGGRLWGEVSLPLMRLVITVATGLLAVFLITAALGLVLPRIGIDHPLSGTLPKWIWGSTLVLIALHCEWKRVDPLRNLCRGVRLRVLSWLVILSIPPILALLGVQRLNGSGRPDLAIGASAIAIALVALAIILPSGHASPPRIMLLSSALLTADWQGPLRGGWLLGGDIQYEYGVANVTLHSGNFPLPNVGDPYRSMLSLTVWPTVLHDLTGMNLRTVLALIPSIILVACLLVVWVYLREWVSDRVAAFMCSLLILGSYSMVRQLPAATRECYGIFFFAVLVLAITSSQLSVRSARTLACLAGVGMAVSHYSTAYIAGLVVIGGWLLSRVVRLAREKRVLTGAVTSFIVGIALVWGFYVARTGSTFRQLVTSIRHDGFQLLPGKGGLVSKWLTGANIPAVVSANTLRKIDLHERATQYRWMVVAPHASRVHLVSDAPPVSHTETGAVGSVLTALGAIQAEFLLVLIVASVIYCCLGCLSDRRMAPIAGMALIGVFFSALSRSSQTLAAQFAPSRVEAQLYLVFSATAAISLSKLASRRQLVQRISNIRLVRAGSIVLAGCAASLALLVSMQLNNVIENKAELVAEYSSTGEQIEQAPSPSDVVAIGWLADHLPPQQFVQSDSLASDVFGDVNLIDVTGNRFIGSIDPVILNEHAWVFASRTNIVLGRAGGGNTAVVSLFRFPRAYLSSTRSVLYASSTDAVFGSMHPN
jgi:hypothetical protein